MDRKSPLPKKLVVEETASVILNPKKPSIVTRATTELAQAPMQGGHGGLIYIISTGAMEKGKGSIGARTSKRSVSYMGLIDIGSCTITGIDVDLSFLRLLPGVMVINPNQTHKFDTVGRLVSNDSNFEKLANPALGEAWSISASREATVAQHSIRGNLRLECSATERVEAATFHPTLAGFARVIKCKGNEAIVVAKGKKTTDYSVTLGHTYVFVEDYRWYFQTGAESEETKNQKYLGRSRTVRKIISLDQ